MRRAIVLLLFFVCLEAQVLTITCKGQNPCIASIYADTNLGSIWYGISSSSGFDTGDNSKVANGTSSLRAPFPSGLGDEYFYVYTTYPWYAGTYDYLQFFIIANSRNAVPLNYFNGLQVRIYNGTTYYPPYPITNCTSGDPNTWQLCTIPMEKLVPNVKQDPQALVSRIYILKSGVINSASMVVNFDTFQLLKYGVVNTGVEQSTESTGDEVQTGKGALSNGASAAIAVIAVLLVVAIGLLVVGAIYFKRKRNHMKPVQLDGTEPHTSMNHISPGMSDGTSVPSGSYYPQNSFRSGVPVGPSNQSFASRENPGKWEIVFDEIVFGEAIGAGAFGEVYVATWRDSRVAVKILTGLVGNEAIEAFIKEATIMTALRPHKNVIQFLGICSVAPNYCIVLEYAEGGSLQHYLSKRGSKVPPKEILFLAQGIAAGMLHLSKERIVHRDLAARNVLLDGQKNPKISDFGMSRCLELSNQGMTKTYVGPVRWMSPEAIRSHEYSEKSDVWSFGVLVWEMHMRQEPYFQRDPLEVALEIREKNMTPEMPKDAHPVFVQLMANCWKPNSKERPSFDDISYFLQETKV